MGLFLAFDAGIPLGLHNALTLPWHWVRALSMYKTVKQIYENSAHDPDGLVAPKLYWFDSELLKMWYQDRRGNNA